MCNLYDIGPGGHRNSTKWEQLVFDVMKDIEKGYGIRKTDPGIALVENPEGEIEPVSMRWGFVRHFNPAINNARSDKLEGMWKHAWESKNRCLIPMSTFYEWSGPKGNKQTHAFQSAEDGKFLWAAGLWEENEDPEIGRCYSMMTTDASEQVEAIHHRMPVLLAAENFENFLQQENPDELLVPYPEELKIFDCRNPLKKTVIHQGPVVEETSDDGMLPGFE